MTTSWQPVAIDVALARASLQVARRIERTAGGVAAGVRGGTDKLPPPVLPSLMLVVLAGRHAPPALPVEGEGVEGKPVEGKVAPAEAALSWRAPEGCPDASAVRSRIGRLVGASSSVAALRVDGVVTAVDGGFSLSLRVVTDGVVDDRVLVADRCEALADTTALVAALAADPIATAGVVDVPALVEAARLGDADAVLGDPTADVGALPPDAGVRPRPSPREREAPRGRTRSSSPVGVWTRLDAGVQFGAVPGVAFGLAGVLAVGGRRLRGELAGSYWLPRTTDRAGTTIRVQLGAVAPRICGTLPQGRIDVVLCAGPELGILRGDVQGGPTRLPLWLAVTAEAGIRVPVSRRVSVWTTVAAAAPVLFPRFRLVDATGTRQREVYRPAAAGVRGLVGIEVRLRGVDR